MNKLPNVYYRAAGMAYVCIFVFAYLGAGLLAKDFYFNFTIDLVIVIVAFFVGMWQHALRYKYNPKERI